VDTVYAVLVAKDSYVSLSTWRTIEFAMAELSNSVRCGDLETLALVAYPRSQPLLWWDAKGRPPLFPMDF
jgi:hypothetical protein